MSYALKIVWAGVKDVIKEENAKIEIAETPQYAGSTWVPSAETMYNYYNSNCYKGD